MTQGHSQEKLEIKLRWSDTQARALHHHTTLPRAASLDHREGSQLEMGKGLETAHAWFVMYLFFPILT